MPTWTNIEDRKNATISFAATLAKDPVLLADCKNSSQTAREAYGTAGNITDIPNDVEFRVFQENDPAIEKLVVIVLPEASVSDKAAPGVDVMRCTRPH